MPAGLNIKGVARLSLIAILAASLLLPASADARGAVSYDAQNPTAAHHRPLTLKRGLNPTGHGPLLNPTGRGRRLNHTGRGSRLDFAGRGRRLAKLADGNPVTIATAVAKRYWNAVPCGGQIAVLADMPLPTGLESTTDGWVTFDSSLGANDLQAPAATYTQCTISLAHWQWPTRGAMEDDWNMFCLTVVHEMGHLLGHPHSLVPGSVMAPVFVNEANVPRICRATRLPAKTALSRAPNH